MSLINEANSDLSHDKLKDRIAQELIAGSLAPAQEVRLANGRIADLVYVARHGAIHIVEVKTEFRAYYLNDAIYKYGSYCHYLWIAFPSHQARAHDLGPCLLSWPERGDAVGMIEADWHRVTVLRQPQLRAPLAVCADHTRNAVAIALTAGEPTPCDQTAPRR